MEEITYKTQGTCAKLIHFKLDKDKGLVRDIRFEGGCNGNLKAIGLLCEGMKADEIVAKLRGNLCGSKGTSCADQLARALSQATLK